ncbi:MAG TPA: hypothetical protein VGH37_04170 [Candidatus Acidoferrum sp.]
MAKKIPKEYKSGQTILVKVSGGRIVEARVNHVIQDRDGTKLQVDFGHDETALIELWQVLEDCARCLDTEAGMGGYPGLRCVKIYLFSKGRTGPATLPGGVTAFPCIPLHSPLMRRRKLSSQRRTTD